MRTAQPARAVVADRARDLIRVFVFFALLVAFVATPLTGAEAVTRPQTQYHERPVQAGPVEPGFPIDFVGVVFDLPAGVDLHDTGAEDRIAVRFRHDGVWGAWQRVEEDGAQAEGTFTGALVSGDDADAYQVRGVPAVAARARAAAINTSDGPLEVVGHRPAGAAEAVTNCKSRADWGAEESLRTSTRSYAATQVLTVHHTATSNLDAATDPDLVVRAIYRYHTQTNGWDDIGYQALVAPNGTVYEGRWSGSDSTSCLSGGGDGSDFGHQTSAADAPIVTGAHTGGYNTGNFGVSLLGHFVDVAPSAAARGALVEYLAELATRHGLDPQGTVAYDNGVNARTAPSIAGHRDYVATECPGGVLYADLPELRSDVAVAMAGGGTEPPPPTDGPVDAVAKGESTLAGAVSGSYLDTHADGGATERVTEVEGGGKPATRTSHLEHVWTVPVTSGSAVTLNVDATASSSSDGDGFAFAYSTDGGATYTPAFTIPSGAGDIWSASLPATTSGDVRVRVLDTNRGAGNRTLDTLTVDHLFVRTEGGAPPPDGGGGEEPTTIDLTASGWKDKGTQVVDLAWAGTSGSVVVTRDDQTVYTGSATTFQDRIGAKGGATYTYRVCESATPTNCSARVTVTF